MSARVIEAKPGERIAVIGHVNLLKLIGWIEAHRPPGDWEPGFLGRCLISLEQATEGVALDKEVTCGGCGLERDLPVFPDVEAGGWFCTDDEACNQRRMGAEGNAS
jgi:hypothetical protein